MIAIYYGEAPSGARYRSVAQEERDFGFRRLARFRAGQYSGGFCSPKSMVCVLTYITIFSRKQTVRQERITPPMKAGKARRVQRTAPDRLMHVMMQSRASMLHDFPCRWLILCPSKAILFYLYSMIFFHARKSFSDISLAVSLFISNSERSFYEYAMMPMRFGACLLGATQASRTSGGESSWTKVPEESSDVSGA